VSGVTVSTGGCLQSARLDEERAGVSEDHVTAAETAGDPDLAALLALELGGELAWSVRIGGSFVVDGERCGEAVGAEDQVRQPAEAFVHDGRDHAAVNAARGTVVMPAELDLGEEVIGLDCEHAKDDGRRVLRSAAKAARMMVGRGDRASAQKRIA
jgi:hypothetical protein